METAKRKERNEASNYVNVNVILEDYFECHNGNDLFNPEIAHYRSFKVKQNMSFQDLVMLIQSTFKVPQTKMRIWSFTPIVQGSSSLYHHNSTNQIVNAGGLTMVDFNDPELLQHPITHFARDHNPWTVYLEMSPPDVGDVVLPPFAPNVNLLVFYKYYDPITKSLTYVGYRVVKNDEKLSDLVPDLNKLIGAPSESTLDFYKPKVKCDPNNAMGSFMKNGDILIFERNEKIPNLELPTYLDYLTDLQYRVDVIFIDKNIQNDNGFTIELSFNSNYDQMAKVHFVIDLSIIIFYVVSLFYFIYFRP
jgi:ubiquitin carboxyl-terminal hydrolase 7